MRGGARTALLTRPRPQSEAFAAQIAEDGWRSLIWPVLEIRPLLTEAPDFSGAEGAILTSARAVEALTPFLAPAEVSPLHAWCVGPATALAATRAGFGEVSEGGGDAARLIATLLEKRPGRLIHVRGRDAAADIAGALRAAGCEADEIIAYAAEPCGAPPDEISKEILSESVETALFFSPRSARLFAEAAPPEWAGALARISALAISEAAAAPLRNMGFRRIMTAKQPNLASMRLLLRCHE